MSALIWAAFGSLDDAKAAAKSLLEEELIACANVMPAVHSIFCWQGEIGEAQECGALFKTDRRLLQQAVTRLEELHPYESPAIFGWHCDEAGAAAQNWLGELQGLGKV